MPDGWTRFEVEETVADYRAMLKLELQGIRYNKSEHRRALALRIKRSDLAIDRKHMNISAILGELGYPWIDGYKPYSNYQNLLYDVVSDQFTTDIELNTITARLVVAAPAMPDAAEVLDSVVPPPDLRPRPAPVEPISRNDHFKFKRNYLEQEACNSALGKAGEEFVLQYERARLLRLGQEKYVDKIEHVAITVGDGEGFDIRSFSPDGTDRFIEVKTTNFGARTPFFVTANELRTSQRKSDQYHLYRVFNFRKDLKQYQVNGPIDGAFSLAATVYRANR